MAHSSSPHHSGQQAPSSAALTACSRKDAILSLIAHRDLFDHTDHNHPEADIRQRYLGPRAERSSVVEFCIGERLRELADFKGEVRLGTIDLESRETWKRFMKIIVQLDRALQWHSRILEEDSRIAQAHVPNQYFMDHGFRRYTSVNRGTRAPNGQFLSCYGSHGDAVGTSFTTPRKCDDDLFRNFFLKRLEGSLTSKIYLQCWKWYHKIFNRELGPEPQGLGGRPLEVVVTAVEYTIFVSCLAGPIALLSSLDAIRDRIIAASFSSLAFPYIAVFLSKEASKTFMLVAAYWAVLAVFIATSGSGSKSC